MEVYNIIKNIVDEDEGIDSDSKQYFKEIIFKIITEIMNLPNERETTIAELLNYNPEKELVDPLTQGKISFLVKKICERINISYIESDKSIGGLAFYVRFKKVDDMEEKEYSMEKNTDFMIKLYRGAVVPKESPRYNNNRVEIAIYTCKLDELEGYKVQIEGKEYNIKNQILLNKIKDVINNNLDTLIKCSLNQNRINLDENAYEGGMGRYIKIKYGQLTIFINGQVRDIGELCDNFINEIVSLIIDHGDKTDTDIT